MTALETQHDLHRDIAALRVAVNDLSARLQRVEHLAQRILHALQTGTERSDLPPQTIDLSTIPESLSTQS